MALTREQILDAQDLQTTSVDIPDWGGSVNVRVMTAHERSRLEMHVNTANKGRHNGRGGLEVFREMLTVECVVDDDGNKLFTRDDVSKLSKKSSRALDAVADVAMQINGMKAAEVDELVGKSEAISAAGSSTD